jgi:hypothetical protein
VLQSTTDSAMTNSISTKEKDLDHPILPYQTFLKKPFRISDKTIIVIHENLVHIDEDTWIEEVETENGLLLKIRNLSAERGR